jgi:hypothetical protein
MQVTVKLLRLDASGHLRLIPVLRRHKSSTASDTYLSIHRQEAASLFSSAGDGARQT